MAAERASPMVIALRTFSATNCSSTARVSGACSSMRAPNPSKMWARRSALVARALVLITPVATMRAFVPSPSTTP